jgi:hypothetical protein
VIIDRVCRALRVDASDLMSRGRHARVVLARALVTIACDLWDRYRSTAWMKAWEAREAEALVFLQPHQPK